MIRKFLALLAVIFSLNLQPGFAEDGYRLWLRYDPIADAALLKTYRSQIKSFIIDGSSPTLSIAGQELQTGLNGLLNQKISSIDKIQTDGTIIIGKVNSDVLKNVVLKGKEKLTTDDSFLIESTKINNKKVIVISANGDIGLLYGVFHFLKLIQTNQNLQKLELTSVPKIERRILNHWDNLDRTVERGYAGFSIWDWHKLPDYIDQRYIDYARANASIGINGTVLTNVNANALILTPDYLKKVAALADLFRPYGIKVYLTARFSAPIEIGKLKTADPLDAEVKAWWKNKADEIYKIIPDFGGFVVKANSEGQPGPQNYGRNHAEGANMLAEALARHNGIVMWRAFVYSNEVPEDRVKQAYNEFKPLDGKFNSNVLIQVKNGPLDFQPREPFHPLFGATPKTPLMMEFQITLEYLGQGTHLTYLAPLFKECLDSKIGILDNHTTVASVVDGSLFKNEISAIAGVANIGNDINWTGHIFGQANWYAYGRLAWDHSLSSEQIADEWIRMTFSNDPSLVNTVKNVMMRSREIVVQYMTPLGLHHIMGYNHHYGPGPWIKDKPRADWTSVYYHQADTAGIGFNRTASGSNALEQYAPSVRAVYESAEKCPEEYLLWFHHLPWDYKMKSGRSLWDELCYTYAAGADSARWMQAEWKKMENKVDTQRWKHVYDLLTTQHKEAMWWRDACLLYFQSHSKRKIPEGLPKAAHTLEYYESLEFPFAPGIRPRW